MGLVGFRDDNDASAVTRSAQSNCLPDAAAGAGDEERFARQGTRHDFLLIISIAATSFSFRRAEQSCEGNQPERKPDRSIESRRLPKRAAKPSKVAVGMLA
jgi:hypothetical protein